MVRRLIRAEFHLFAARKGRHPSFLLSSTDREAYNVVQESDQGGKHARRKYLYRWPG